MQNPLVSQFINPVTMIIDAIVATSVPMFAVYTILFLAYQPRRINLLNRAIKYLSIFTSALGKFFLYIASILFGIATYTYFNGMTNITIYLAVYTTLTFVVAGSFFLYYANFQIKANRLLDNYAPLGALLCATLTMLGYFYGVLSDPIRLWFAIGRMNLGS